MICAPDRLNQSFSVKTAIQAVWNRGSSPEMAIQPAPKWPLTTANRDPGSLDHPTLRSKRDPGSLEGDLRPYDPFGVGMGAGVGVLDLGFPRSGIMA